MKSFKEIIKEDATQYLKTIKKSIKSASNLINNQLQTKGKDGKMIQVDYKKKDDEFLIRYGKNETEYFDNVAGVIKFVNGKV